MGVGRMTLIRLIRSLPDPVAATAPGVLGVDEFALRRGHSDGTLLVGCQSTSTPAARSLSWPTDRPIRSPPGWPPGCWAEVICRDRAGCYAEAAARAAPLAIQVADRWHLWPNLGEAVKKAVVRPHDCLGAATAIPDSDGQPGPAPQTHAQDHSAPRPDAAAVEPGLHRRRPAMAPDPRPRVPRRILQGA